MPLRVFHNGSRRIKAHRLIVEQTGVKLRRAMHFQIGAAVSKNRKADRVRFRKSVKRKRRDRMDDLVDLVRRNILPLHRCTKFYADLVHSLFRTMKTQRAT